MIKHYFTILFLCFLSAPAFTQTRLPAEVTKKLWATICDTGCTREEWKRWNANLQFEIHDLNADSNPEYFLFIDHSDWCGAGSNCDYWIFQKKGNDYILLLNDKNLRVENSVSNGYHNLASQTPMGFCARNVQRFAVTHYKFDGEKYVGGKLVYECHPFTPPTK